MNPISLYKNEIFIEPKGRTYVKGYGFLSFAKKIDKKLSNKYSQKLLDSAKKSTMDAIKTSSKRGIQKNRKSNWWFNW